MSKTGDSSVQLLPKTRRLGRSPHCGREALRIPSVEVQPAHLVLHLLRHAADVAADHRPSVLERLEHDQRARLPPDRRHDHPVDAAPSGVQLGNARRPANDTASPERDLSAVSNRSWNWAAGYRRFAPWIHRWPSKSSPRMLHRLEQHVGALVGVQLAEEGEAVARPRRARPAGGRDRRDGLRLDGRPLCRRCPSRRSARSTYSLGAKKRSTRPRWDWMNRFAHEELLRRHGREALVAAARALLAAQLHCLGRRTIWPSR